MHRNAAADNEGMPVHVTRINALKIVLLNAFAHGNGTTCFPDIELITEIHTFIGPIVSPTRCFIGTNTLLEVHKLHAVSLDAKATASLWVINLEARRAVTSEESRKKSA
jgi:hypothetical protein